MRYLERPCALITFAKFIKPSPEALGFFLDPDSDHRNDIEKCDDQNLDEQKNFSRNERTRTFEAAKKNDPSIMPVQASPPYPILI